LIHEEAGDTAGALRMYELAIEKRPRSPLVRTQMADFLDRVGQTQAALDVLRGLDRADATAAYCQKLFDLCWKLGLTEDARAAAARACELAPYDPESRARLARLQL
jgi:predicted Zn-dependent protease